MSDQLRRLPPSRGVARVVILLTLCAGCAGLPGVAKPVNISVPLGVSAAPGGLDSFALPTSALAAALESEEIEPTIVDIPDLPSWPRFLRFRGPMYALVQFEPYVGQMGILADKERADAGMGIGFVGGVRTPMAGGKSLGFEGLLGMSRHYNAASDVDANATRLAGAVRMSFGADEKVVPFVVGGVGRYRLSFDKLPSEYNLSGLGALVGGGVEYVSGGTVSARAELTLHIWDAAQPDGGGGLAETLVLALGAAFSF